MSSVVVSTSAALGRPFLFENDVEESLCHPERSEKCVKRISRGVEGPLHSHDPWLASITPASRLEIRPIPEMSPSGIAEIDALTGGFPRGCLTEIYGPASSGRTTLLMAALSAATQRGEFCAVIDAGDALDPQSLADAGVDLDRFLWVRCNEDAPRKSRPGTSQAIFQFAHRAQPAFEHRLEQVLRATDLLLESGGFGLILLDLADVPPHAARRIPLTTWFRFRRAVEHKPTILLALEQQPIAGSCSSLLLELRAPSSVFSSANPAEEIRPSHVQLLGGLEINMELIRSRLDRKPAQSIAFETKTAWAG